MIHSYSFQVRHGESEQTIRAEVMDKLCKDIKRDAKPSGYTFFHISTSTFPTAAEISYIRLFGYCIEYIACVSDYLVTWGGHK
jgi:hypothetical protein